ncbi:MAG: threonylcarbamoyl-AMP synthase [Prolixibacteraceae bacterium]|nr:threonylcarbamoyl-AMP synthase [Prolixibacteraceae bacterium]MBN2650385.1 threonylcarbamoyl-AMP synthase [Prolixibacteraceae bacterium]
MIKGKDVAYAAQCLKSGELVAFPTETVYGLGADAFNARAVAKVFEVKQRPKFDPLIVHISSIDQIEELFLQPIDEKVYRLAEAFWPGPLTIVFNRSAIVPDIVSSGLPTVAVRMPSHPLAVELIRLAGTPLVAPSANRFGKLSPTQASHVEKQLDGPAYLLDGGSTDYGVESTVVLITKKGVKILRPGAVTAEELATHVKVLSHKNEFDELNVPSPGMLKSHYAPRKPLYIIDKPSELNYVESDGIIIASEQDRNLYSVGRVKALSKSGNLQEIAVNLFAVLHQMEDDDEVEDIYIEAIKEEGVGMAVMDRIRKAAYSYQK